MLARPREVSRGGWTKGGGGGGGGGEVVVSIGGNFKLTKGKSSEAELARGV